MRCVVLVLLAATALAPAAALAAEGAPTGADDSVITVLPGPEPAELPPPRPRLSAAVGMGATFDPVGFGNGAAHAIPAFFGTGGIGDGFFGVDLLAFASSGAGRFANDDPIDRLALHGFAVVRPAAQVRPYDDRYQLRVLRTLAAELGLGFERDGRTMTAGTRFVVHTGARVELPLTPAGSKSELRARLAVNRAFGLYTPRLYGATASDLTEVVDTAAEVYTALVLVF
jgi:hypothetical protein